MDHDFSSSMNQDDIDFVASHHFDLNSDVDGSLSRSESSSEIVLPSRLLRSSPTAPTQLITPSQLTPSHDNNFIYHHSPIDISTHPFSKMENHLQDSESASPTTKHFSSFSNLQTNHTTIINNPNNIIHPFDQHHYYNPSEDARILFQIEEENQKSNQTKTIQNTNKMQHNSNVNIPNSKNLHDVYISSHADVSGGRESLEKMILEDFHSSMEIDSSINQINNRNYQQQQQQGNEEDQMMIEEEGCESDSKNDSNRFKSNQQSIQFMHNQPNNNQYHHAGGGDDRIQSHSNHQNSDDSIHRNNQHSINQHSNHIHHDDIYQEDDDDSCDSYLDSEHSHDSKSPAISQSSSELHQSSSIIANRRSNRQRIQTQPFEPPIKLESPKPPKKPGRPSKNAPVRGRGRPRKNPINSTTTANSINSTSINSSALPISSIQSIQSTQSIQSIQSIANASSNTINGSIQSSNPSTHSFAHNQIHHQNHTYNKNQTIQQNKTQMQNQPNVKSISSSSTPSSMGPSLPTASSLPISSPSLHPIMPNVNSISSLPFTQHALNGWNSHAKLSESNVSSNHIESKKSLVSMTSQSHHSQTISSLSSSYGQSLHLSASVPNLPASSIYFDFYRVFQLINKQIQNNQQKPEIKYLSDLNGTNPSKPVENSNKSKSTNSIVNQQQHQQHPQHQQHHSHDHHHSPSHDLHHSPSHDPNFSVLKGLMESSCPVVFPRLHSFQNSVSSSTFNTHPTPSSTSSSILPQHGIKVYSCLDCKSAVFGLSLSPDGKFLAAATRLGQIHLFSASEVSNHHQSSSLHSNTSSHARYNPYHGINSESNNQQTSNTNINNHQSNNTFNNHQSNNTFNNHQSNNTFNNQSNSFDSSISPHFVQGSSSSSLDSDGDSSWLKIQWSLVAILGEVDSSRVDEFWNVCWSQNGNHLICSGASKSRHSFDKNDSDLSILPCPIVIFDLYPPKDENAEKTNEKQNSNESSTCFPSSRRFYGHTEEIVSMQTVLFDGDEYLVTSSQDGSFRKWKFDSTFQSLICSQTFKDDTTSMAFSFSFLPNSGNKYFIAAADDGLKLFDFETLQLIQTWPFLYDSYCDYVQVISTINEVEYQKIKVYQETMLQEDKLATTNKLNQTDSEAHNHKNNSTNWHHSVHNDTMKSSDASENALNQDSKTNRFSGSFSLDLQGLSFLIVTRGNDESDDQTHHGYQDSSQYFDEEEQMGFYDGDASINSTSTRDLLDYDDDGYRGARDDDSDDEFHLSGRKKKSTKKKNKTNNKSKSSKREENDQNMNSISDYDMETTSNSTTDKTRNRIHQQGRSRSRTSDTNAIEKQNNDEFATQAEHEPNNINSTRNAAKRMISKVDLRILHLPFAKSASRVDKREEKQQTNANEDFHQKQQTNNSNTNQSNNTNMIQSNTLNTSNIDESSHAYRSFEWILETIHSFSNPLFESNLWPSRIACNGRYILCPSNQGVFFCWNLSSKQLSSALVASNDDCLAARNALFHPYWPFLFTSSDDGIIQIMAPCPMNDPSIESQVCNQTASDQAASSSSSASIINHSNNLHVASQLLLSNPLTQASSSSSAPFQRSNPNSYQSALEAAFFASTGQHLYASPVEKRKRGRPKKKKVIEQIEAQFAQQEQASKTLQDELSKNT